MKKGSIMRIVIKERVKKIENLIKKKEERRQKNNDYDIMLNYDKNIKNKRGETCHKMSKFSKNYDRKIKQGENYDKKK